MTPFRSGTAWPHTLRGALLLWCGVGMGCNALFGIDGLTYEDPSDHGGGAGTGGTGTTTGTSTGGATGGGALGGAGGAGGGGVEPLISCDDQYGTLDGYYLCAETATQCRLLSESPASCTEVCTSCGGECEHAGTNHTCANAGTVCDMAADISQCDCSRGCGLGPPCVLPQTCASGICQ